jgi:hypothetical protein
MQNLITVNKKHIKRIFDLKGSRVERITKNIEKCDKMKTLKDLDYLWMIKIEEDVSFILSRWSILLLIIAKNFVKCWKLT